MATTLILVRHGETDWNREHRLQGWADPPLNADGREQARALAASIRGEPISSVVTSDLRRATETAAIVAAAIGATVSEDVGLREVDLGSWSGRLWSEIEGTTRPDGESRDAHRARVVAAVDRIAAAHGGRSVLVVSHGGSIGALVAHVTGERSQPLGNCAMVRIEWDDGRMTIADGSVSDPLRDSVADDAEALARG